MLREYWNGATGLVKLLFIIVVAALLWFAIWLVIIRPMMEHRAAVEAKAQGAYSGAAAQSGVDAVGTLSTQQSVEAKRAESELEAEHAINSTSGASTTIASDTNAAGLRTLCMRNAYRDSPRCRQLLKPSP